MTCRQLQQHEQRLAACEEETSDQGQRLKQLEKQITLELAAQAQVKRRQEEYTDKAEELQLGLLQRIAQVSHCAFVKASVQWPKPLVIVL